LQTKITKAALSDVNHMKIKTGEIGSCELLVQTKKNSRAIKISWIMRNVRT